MSSMNNSQDDAQYQSSKSKQLNRNNDSRGYKSSQLSKQSLNTLGRNPADHKSNQQSQRVNSIKSISDKLNEPLITQQVHLEARGLLDSDTRLDAQTLNNNKAVKQKAGIDIKALRGGISHPNFDETKQKEVIDPNRPLTDIPEPAPRYKEALNMLLTLEFEGGKEMKVALQAAKSEPLAPSNKQASFEKASMWALIASPELASHLELLQIGGLINLPASFFEPVPNKSADTTKSVEMVVHSTQRDASASTPPVTQTQKALTEAEAVSNNTIDQSPSEIKQVSQLLNPLTEMTLLDMSDIHRACAAYPQLTRYGFIKPEPLPGESTDTLSTQELSSAMPEMINDIFAPNWELILYPERFDNGVDSLLTDILACSVAVHILKQCTTRKTPNRKITAQQICQHMRSYVLSQCNMNPHFETQYRQIRLFVGHVIVAAHYLGLTVTQSAEHTGAHSINSKGEPSANLGQPIYLNISSRSALLTRYPNISDYYINGWS